VTYDVDWLETAQRKLEAIWRAADSRLRTVIARAVPRINDRLAVAPYSQGESRLPGEARLLFELPIKVYYRIERYSGAVTVLAVRLVSKRKR